MGRRGPVPKRSSERRRRNKQPAVERVLMVGEVRVPPLPQGTHKIARRLYRSLADSGQSRFFEPSDWALALWLADQMTRLLKQDGPASSKDFASVWAAAKDLMSTEASRRRAQIEVVRGDVDDDDDAPTALDDYRERMKSS